jgi:hypothetical protein
MIWTASPCVVLSGVGNAEPCMAIPSSERSISPTYGWGVFRRLLFLPSQGGWVLMP